jgi:hypothetical protein
MFWEAKCFISSVGCAGGDAAIESGSILRLKWVLERASYCWTPQRAYSTAARLGLDEMLQFLIASYPSVCEWQTTMDKRARTLNTLGFIMESEDISNKRKVDMLSLCLSLGCPMTADALVSTARLGLHAKPFQCMQLLLDRNCPLKTAIVSEAASGAPLEVTRHALKRAYGYDDALLSELAGSSSPTRLIEWPLAKVQWLRARGVPWSSGTLAAAAKYGNIGLLRWAYDNGCQMSPNVMTVATWEGQIAAMQWLHKHGCPAEPDSIIKAVANAQMKALIWLVEEAKVPFEYSTRIRAQKALMKALCKARAPATRNASLYRRAIAFDKSAKAKGYWQ